MHDPSRLYDLRTFWAIISGKGSLCGKGHSSLIVLIPLFRAALSHWNTASIIHKCSFFIIAYYFDANVTVTDAHLELVISSSCSQALRRGVRLSKCDFYNAHLRI